MAGFDLHMHTTASDGLHSPQVVVQMAKKAGLDGIAITDHDTVMSVETAVRAGEEIGIKVIPGVEISTFYGGQDIHILGYGIDPTDAQFLDRLYHLRSLRKNRNALMVKRFNELGIGISEQEVNDLARELGGEDVSVGRPHFAALLVKKGIVSTVQEAFDLYLAKNGRAYVSVQRITPEQAVSWIRECGGKAVIAHPGIYDDDELVKEIIRIGVDGIEVCHSDHGQAEEERYHQMAKQHNLIATAGSDFHGDRDGDVFHGAIGSKRVSIETVKQLLDK